MTTAYIVFMVPFGLLWWSKPYAVDCPTLLVPPTWPEGTRARLKERSEITGFVMFKNVDLVECERMRNSVAMEER